MARRRFGADMTSVVLRDTTIDGVPALTLGANVSGITAWTAQAGGAQVTDLTTAGGAATTTLTTDADGNLDFFGPNTTPETVVLWLQGAGPGDTRQQIVASDLPASLAASISALAAGVAASARAADVMYTIFYGTGTPPLRTTRTTDTAKVVMWIGSTAPPIATNGAGGAAVDGLDLWVRF